MDDSWQKLLDAIAGPNPTIDGFAVCAEIAKREAGCRCLTVTLQDEAAGTVERIYSELPDSWAIGGKKKLSFGIWSEQVIGKKAPFVANSYEEMAAVFNDHAVSEGLGLGAIVNVPIIVGGTVIGTANVLNVPGFYSTPESIAKAVALRPYFTVAMLTAK